jgi:hypothetical protein
MILFPKRQVQKNLKKHQANNQNQIKNKSKVRIKNLKQW